MKKHYFIEHEMRYALHREDITLVATIIAMAVAFGLILMAVPL